MVCYFVMVFLRAVALNLHFIVLTAVQGDQRKLPIPQPIYRLHVKQDAP